jgi:transcriptional regulator with XRE-family HTH domain
MRSATHVDRKVGENLLRFRLLRGMTQEQLAAAVGVTFQQIQKYENGRNRISASRLWAFSEALGVPVADFYAGLNAGSGDAAGLTVEQQSVLAALSSLRRSHRTALMAYIRFLKLDAP